MSLHYDHAFSTNKTVYISVGGFLFLHDEIPPKYHNSKELGAVLLDRRFPPRLLKCWLCKPWGSEGRLKVDTKSLGVDARML